MKLEGNRQRDRYRDWKETKTINGKDGKSMSRRRDRKRGDRTEQSRAEQSASEEALSDKPRLPEVEKARDSPANLFDIAPELHAFVVALSRWERERAVERNMFLVFLLLLLVVSAAVSASASNQSDRKIRRSQRQSHVQLTPDSATCENNQTQPTQHPDTWAPTLGYKDRATELRTRQSLQLAANQ